MEKNNVKVYCKNCKWYSETPLIGFERCSVFSIKNKKFTRKKTNSIDNNIYLWKNNNIYLWKNIELIRIIYKYFTEIDVDDILNIILTDRWGLNRYEEVEKGGIDGIIDLWYDNDKKYCLNNNYNCPLYERKWWKFWVKERKSNFSKKELQTIIILDKTNF